MKSLKYLLFSLFFLASFVCGAEVRLAWNPNPETNIAGYQLLWGTASRQYDKNQTVGATTTTASVSELEAGKTYFFAVKAFNTIGLYSDLSEEVSYSVPMPPITGISIMDRNAWTVTVSSELGTDRLKSNAIDGKADTYWHSQRRDAPIPHWIAANLGSEQSIKGFRCQPRLPEHNPDNRALLKDWEMYVSNDGIQWGNPVATGQFPWDHSTKEFVLPNAVLGRHIKIQMVTAWGEPAPYAFQLAEFYVLIGEDEPIESPTPPVNLRIEP